MLSVFIICYCPMLNNFGLFKNYLSLSVYSVGFFYKDLRLKCILLKTLFMLCYAFSYVREDVKAVDVC